jgi:hypothetical protein
MTNETLGQWSDPVPMQTSKAAELPEVIPESRLPAGCQLQKLRALSITSGEAASDTHRALSNFQRELAEVEALLRNATVSSCTPLDFATATGRQTLLERAVGDASDEAQRAEKIQKADRAQFVNEYTAYSMVVRDLRARVDVTGLSISAERRGQLLRDVERYVGSPAQAGRR